MKSKKKIIVLVVIILIMTIGVSFAFYNNIIRGTKNQVLIAGDIYMNYVETNQINITDAIPMKKETALNQENNVFNFTISGKNTSTKDIFYGISLQEGDEIVNKIRINPKNINVYLTSGEDILLDAIRYDSFGNKIYVDTIPGGTNSYNKNYSLRVWIDENTIISDTDPNADYTIEEWNKTYFSFKVNVDGNLESMNIPLSIETSDIFVENGKSYFLVNITNYLNPSEENEILATSDNMNLNITGTNNNTVFTYYDNLGNEENTSSSSLDLNYIFTKKTSVTVKVYVTSVNDANQSTDINITLIKNEDETYSVAKNVSIVGNNYCLNNGFTSLHDCILVSEYMSNNVNDAKSMISAKGSPNLNDTAPSYTYTEKVTQNVSNAYTGNAGYNWYFGSGYTFNSNTGAYTLTDYVNDELSSSYLNYYTCGATNYDYSNCSTIYKVLGIDLSSNKLTLADVHTYQIASSLDSQVGLYEVEDDDGASYIYRGNVTNNNVYFGGFYWKILRTNGDGSIRLIYNGTTPNATGIQTDINNTVYQYNSRYSDPTYVGYMYGDNDMEVIRSNLTTYTNIEPATKYYFASNYTFNDVTKMFTLSGNITSVPYTYSEMNSNNLFGTYPYSCKGTTLNATCEVIIETSSYISNANVRAYLIGYNSASYENTLEDNQSSNVKIALDDWYQNNILNGYDNNHSLLTNYLTDEVFCNDRSLLDQGGNGFSPVPSTYYAGYTRLASVSKTGDLICSTRDNKFTTTASKGNGKLIYPVGSITADEVALAGGKYDEKNEDFYLKTNSYYWTMSPSNFSSSNSNASVWYVNPSGILRAWTNVVNLHGIRAVINLRFDTLISQGDGTINNPYILRLA